MKTERSFDPCSDRYAFDFTLTGAKGWAQVDSGQDASYYGNWANPEMRRLVSFCEGDITIRTAADDQEFAAALRETVDWMRGNTGKGAVDCMCNEAIKERFERIGCADLLHPVQ